MLATLAQLIPIRSHLGQLSRIAIAEPMTVGAVDKVQAPLTKWLLDRADKLATAFLKELLSLNGSRNSAHWLEDLLLKAGHQSDRLNI